MLATALAAKDWLTAARSLAHEADPEAALAQLERDVPRPWREPVIAAVLCMPRTDALQAALVASGRWERWRAVLPHTLAATFLTLCHPPHTVLRCGGCDGQFTAATGILGPSIELCERCMRLKRHRPRATCLLCQAPTPFKAAGFCTACGPQVDALLEDRPKTPPPIPRGLEEMFKQRLVKDWAGG